MKKFLAIGVLLYSLGAAGQQAGKAPSVVRQKPFVLGKSDEIHSAVLGEDRTLNIYLPSGYKAGDTTRYPVIYLLDGSADEDFIHIAGLVQYYTFPWIAQLPESIVVGIANTHRMRDFTYPSSQPEEREKFPAAGGGAAFTRFIREEVQPYIQKQYHGQQQGTLIGQSLGGLLATEILFREPGLFHTYILVSPSLWWDNGAILDRQPAVPLPGGRPLRVYIGVGKEGLAPSRQPHVMEVDANILADKLKQRKDIGVYFDYLPARDHATTGHQAISNAFQLLSDKPGADR